jgi:hypothetical protein
MKTIIVLGTGYSGSSAINDYLISRNDFQDLFKGGEFRLVNDPGGIDELYNSFYKNYSLNCASNALKNFKKLIKNSYYSNYNKKFPIYKNDIFTLTEQFIKNITYISYNGAPKFYLDDMSSVDKLILFFKRKILKKSSREVDLLDMILPCSEKDFLNFTEDFLNKIIRSQILFDENKNIVIEQGGNFLNPISSTKYFGKNVKIIVVFRDPKAIFWSIKRRKSLNYPSYDIEIFVEWYKKIREMYKACNSENIINIKFEHFFENFETEKKKLEAQLDIKNSTDSKFNIRHTLNNLYKYKDNLTKNEIDYINLSLKDFI